MKGLLFITIDTEVRLPWFNHGDKPYFGFNGGYGVELWKGLDEWNNANPYYKLKKDAEEDFVSLEDLENVKKYVDSIKAKYGDSFYLIIVDEVTDNGNVFKDFTFVGYDCGYIYGDEYEDWYALFSCIKNELLKEREYINPFLQPSFLKLNQYGLFQSYEDALSFKVNRDVAISQKHIGGIETAFKQFGIVRIFLYDKSNPVSASKN